MQSLVVSSNFKELTDDEIQEVNGGFILFPPFQQAVIKQVLRVMPDRLERDMGAGAIVGVGTVIVGKATGGAKIGSIFGPVGIVAGALGGVLLGVGYYLKR